MFVVELIYKAELREIDAHMPEHMRFLERHYTSGHFVVSGRKIPRDGGIILALAKDRAEIEGIMKEDPFVANGLADLRVTEFRISQRAADLDARIPKASPVPRRR